MSYSVFFEQGSMVYVECQEKTWYGELVSYNIRKPYRAGSKLYHIILKDRYGKQFNVPQKRTNEAFIYNNRSVLIEKFKKSKYEYY
jgi:hypothetical protein